MSRTVPIQTSDTARFHASTEGVLELEQTWHCSEYVVDEGNDNRVDVSELVAGLEGQRVHIIVFVEP
jgi:hypothetical protein